MESFDKSDIDLLRSHVEYLTEIRNRIAHRGIVVLTRADETKIDMACQSINMFRMMIEKL